MVSNSTDPFYLFMVVSAKVFRLNHSYSFPLKWTNIEECECRRIIVWHSFYNTQPLRMPQPPNVHAESSEFVLAFSRYDCVLNFTNIAQWIWQTTILQHRTPLPHIKRVEWWSCTRRALNAFCPVEICEAQNETSLIKNEIDFPF